MKKSRLLGAVYAVLLTLITMSANAALIGRLPATPGGTDYQAAYDTVLDITWVTDADMSGNVNWDNQVAWASGLDYLGFDDWRLASMSVAAGTPTGSATSVVDCSTATEVACRDNELGYMFYHNMGGVLGNNKTGNQMVDGVLLTDVWTSYWSGTEFGPESAWFFFFDPGDQYHTYKTAGPPGWAVRSGDVVPPAYVTIEIMPSKKAENVINLKKKNLKVAILGSIEFDALQVEPTTVKFGTFGPDAASPIRYKGQDYNRDGYSDLILTFNLSETGIACGVTEATLTGQTDTDPIIYIEGSDSFSIKGCQ